MALDIYFRGDIKQVLCAARRIQIDSCVAIVRIHEHLKERGIQVDDKEFNFLYSLYNDGYAASLKGIAEGFGISLQGIDDDIQSKT